MSASSKNIVQYVTIVLAYVCVVASSALAIVLSVWVGAPDLLYIMQAISIALNLAQVATYIVYAVRSGRGMGRGIGRIKTAILVLNLAWVALTLANFIVSSVGAYIRWDLAVVWGCQSLTVLLVYAWWSRIEGSVIARAVRDASFAPKAPGAMRRKYMAFVIVVALVQVASLVVPAFLVSSLYRNTNLEYRTIHYQLNESRTEYYVAGVYWGQSKKVLIPANFNGLPVTKVLDGALDSKSVQNKLWVGPNAIEEIIFEDTEESPSNVRYLGKRAIVNDDLSSLTLPASVEELGHESVNCANLEVLNLYNQAGKVYFGSSVVAPVLKTVNINASSDATIEFTQGYNTRNLALNVINDGADGDTAAVQAKYNYLRENYPELQDNLQATNVAGVIVDFCTNMEGLFVPSRILDVNSGVAVLNTAFFGKMQLATEEYTKNRTYLSQEEGYVFAPEGNSDVKYVFRGWVDANGNDVVFSKDSFSTTLSQSMTLSARWAEIRTVSYDWGNYYEPLVKGDLPRAFVVGEEVNNFALPTIDDLPRAGYSELKWYCFDRNSPAYSGNDENANYTHTVSFAQSVVLTPVWTLSSPEITRTIVVESDTGIQAKPTTNVVFTYNPHTMLNTTYTIAHPLNRTNTYRLMWDYVPNDEAAGYGTTAQSGSFMFRYDDLTPAHYMVENIVNSFLGLNQVQSSYDIEKDEFHITLGIQNVVQSGTYSVSIEVVSANPERDERISVSTSSDYSVTVEPMVYECDTNALVWEETSSHVYDGTDKSRQLLNLGGLDVRFEYVYENNKNQSEVGTHYVTAKVFKLDDNRDDPNYTFGTMHSSFDITLRPVTVRWRLDGEGDYGTEFVLPYDGRVHHLEAYFGDGVPDEIKTVTLTLTTDESGRDIGTYLAAVADIPAEYRDKYAYVQSGEYASECSFTIVPRVVEMVWDGADSFTYDGIPHCLAPRVNNLCDGDVCDVACDDLSVNRVNGVYVQDNRVFSRNVGIVTVQVMSLGNANYTLEGATNLTHKLTVTHRPINVIWGVSAGSAAAHSVNTTYDAMEQAVYAYPTNLVEGDELGFAYTIGNVAGNTAKNAGTYTLRITAITDHMGNGNYTNYTLDGLSPSADASQRACLWIIDKQPLTVKWDDGNEYEVTYNGNYFEYGLTVSGFRGDDVVALYGTDVNPVFGNYLTCTGATVVLGSRVDGQLDQYRLMMGVCNAGVYSLRCGITSALSANYTMLTSLDQTRVAVVQPKMLAFDWYVDEECSILYNDDAFTYDRTVYMVFPKERSGYLVFNQENKVKDTVSIAAENFAKIAAGEYVASILDVGNPNYTWEGATNATQAWRIAKKTVYLSGSDSTHTYDGADRQLVVTTDGIRADELADVMVADNWTVSGVVPTFRDDGTIVFAAKNRGEYSLAVSAIVGNCNYELKAPITVTMRINRRDMAFSNWTDNATMTYNGADREVVFTIGNLANADVTALCADSAALTVRTDTNDAYPFTVQASPSDEGSVLVTLNLRAAGTYALTATLDSDNYNGTSAANSYTILPETLVFRWVDNSDADNDSPTSFVYDGVNTSAKIRALPTNLCEGDAITVVYSGDLTAIAKGNYTKTVAGVYNANYTLDESSNLSFAWSVTQRVITFEWSDSVTHGTAEASYTYSKNNVYNRIYAEITNLCDGDTVVLTYAGDTAAIDVGDYTKTVTAISNANYVLGEASGASYSWSIVPKSVSFRWKDTVENGAAKASYTYSKENTYNRIIAEITNLCAGDTVDLTYEGDTSAIDACAENAAAYQKRVTSLDNDNYTLTGAVNVAYQWRIVPRTLEFVWKDSIENVDCPDYFMYNAADTYTRVIAMPTNLCDGDTVVSTYTGTDTAINATANKDYTKTVATINNANYALPGVAVTYHWGVAKAPLCVAWYWDEKDTPAASAYTYRGAAYTLTPGFTGQFDVDVSCDVADATFTDVGAYTARVYLTGVSAGNYYIAEGGQCAWCIEQQIVTLDWSGMDGEYNAATRSIRVQVGRDTGDFDDIVAYSWSGASTTAQADGWTFGSVDAGTYTASVSIKNGNYRFADATLATKTLTISPKALEQPICDWDNGSHTFDNQSHDLTVLYAGVYERDLATINVVGATCSWDANGLTLTYAVKNSRTYSYSIAALNGNYAIDTFAATYTVAEKSVTVTWLLDGRSDYEGGAYKVVYDTANHAVTCSLNGVIEGDTCAFTLQNANEVNAQDVTTTITLTNGNYVLGGASALNWTIEKQVITLAWMGDAAYEYDRQSHGVSVEATFVDLETKPSNWTTILSITRTGLTVTTGGGKWYASAVDAKDVDYAATVSVASNYSNNYCLDENTQTTRTWRINPKPVTIEWALDGDSTFEITFDGNAHSITASAVGVIDGDACVAQKTGNITGTNANTGANYSVTVTGLNNKNYRLADAAVTTKTWRINPAPVTVTWSDANSFTYNATAQGVCASIECAVGSLSDILSISKSTSVTENKVGADWYFTSINASSNEYFATLSIKSGVTNYVLGGTGTKTWTISPAPVTVTWSDDDAFTYDATAQGVYATIACAVGSPNDYMAYSTATAVMEPRKVGNKWYFEIVNANANQYGATLSIKSGVTNYVLVGGASTKTWTISPATITLGWSEVGVFTYNAAAQGRTLTIGGAYDNTGEILNATTTGTLSKNGNKWTFAAENKGDYSASVSIKNSNYVLAEGAVATKEWTINPVEVSVDWSTDATSFDYSASAVTITATLTCAVDAPLGVECVSPNVNVSTVGNVWTFSTTNAGAYTASLSFDNDNHVWADTTNAIKTKGWTINPATVSVNWSNTSFTYDGGKHSPQATFMWGDVNVTEQMVGVTYANDSDKKDVSGSYVIVVNSGTYGNFRVEKVSGQSWAITPKAVTVAWNNTAPTYDGNEQSVTATALGVVDGDTCTVTLSNASATNAGDYTAFATGVSNANYVLAEDAVKTQSWRIDPKPITVVWKLDEEDRDSVTYDRATHTVTATALGVVDGDTCTVTLSNASATNAGDYTALATGVSNANYVLAAGEGTKTWTIDPKPITVVWKLDGGDAFSVTYKGSAYTVTATPVGVVDGDTCTVTLSNASATDAGDYTALATGVSNANYVLAEDAVKTQPWSITARQLERTDLTWYYAIVEIGNYDPGDADTVVGGTWYGYNPDTGVSLPGVGKGLVFRVEYNSISSFSYGGKAQEMSAPCEKLENLSLGDVFSVSISITGNYVCDYQWTFNIRRTIDISNRAQDWQLSYRVNGSTDDWQSMEWKEWETDKWGFGFEAATGVYDFAISKKGSGCGFEGEDSMPVYTVGYDIAMAGVSGAYNTLSSGFNTTKTFRTYYSLPAYIEFFLQSPSA